MGLEPPGVLPAGNDLDDVRQALLLQEGGGIVVATGCDDAQVIAAAEVLEGFTDSVYGPEVDGRVQPAEALKSLAELKQVIV